MSRLPRLSPSTVLLCVATLAIGYLAFSTARYVVHNYQLRGQEAQVRADLRQLDQDHSQLVAVRDYLKSDQYVEGVARQTLGLVRPGETLVIVSPADDVPTATATPDDLPPGTPWWKALFFAPMPAPTP